MCYDATLAGSGHLGDGDFLRALNHLDPIDRRRHRTAPPVYSQVTRRIAHYRRWLELRTLFGAVPIRSITLAAAGACVTALEIGQPCVAWPLVSVHRLHITALAAVNYHTADARRSHLANSYLRAFDHVPSIGRFIAAEAGFLTLIQCRDRPARYG
jgi:hypothetical protein